MDHAATPLTFEEKRKAEQEIAAAKEEIANLQEEIKAFTAMSAKEAVVAIEERQARIRKQRGTISALQRELDRTDLQDEIATLTAQIEAIKDRTQTTLRLLRAGAIPVGQHRKGVYYNQVATDNPASPFALRHFQDAPVLTTDDAPYMVIFGGQDGKDPTTLRTSFTSAAGNYIDVDPVRPLVTQTTVPSVSAKTHNIRTVTACDADVAETLVDRILPITDHLAGETIYAVSVTGRATVTPAPKPDGSDKPQSSVQDIKLLDAEALPQVHSLYRYNLGTGVLWTSVRAPSFSRVPNGGYYPDKCDPTAVDASCKPVWSKNQ